LYFQETGLIMAYTPLFKRLKTNEETAALIKKIQDDFEAMWMPLNKSINPNAEKTLGMRKMQEACMWLCRAAAAGGLRQEPKATGLCAPSVKAKQPE
jgi:hypothetical protein